MAEQFVHGATCGNHRLPLVMKMLFLSRAPIFVVGGLKDEQGSCSKKP
jgi:hypothetical protein